MMKIPAAAMHRGDFLLALLLTTLLLCGQAAVAAANASAAAPATDQATVGLLVYKKWIGASGDEADVEIHLSCPGKAEFEPRFINRDRPDGWQIEQVPADGIFCNVNEIERDTFIADVSDCRDLLLVPGQDVECTMVNTKVVKKIDMLNRYGLVLMIAVMLGAGLAAVRKFTPGSGAIS
jgi:hypothetical protein